ncbi:hypothetical protein IFM89_038329 [Coptis chinensis]|uniref:Uncharacterized protein n=1 Tax=Coptis chinensis TaxID=261450 RepID=A0A835LUK6_9MAGN|nr:hypothetical protein IFM89_038329 [Coptis chinensis]
MHGNRIIIVENTTLVCRYIYLELFDSEVEAARSSRVFFKFVEGGQLTKLEGFRQSLFQVFFYAYICFFAITRIPFVYSLNLENCQRVIAVVFFGLNYSRYRKV